MITTTVDPTQPWAIARQLNLQPYAAVDMTAYGQFSSFCIGK
jgi:hypothetical protein